MTYHGRIKNGTVVFDDAPPLREGTPVRVEPESSREMPRGSREMLLAWRTRWAGPVNELERLLDQVQEMRDADLTPGVS